MKNLQYILCRNREDCATASERKYAADIFYIEDCMTASVNISILFNERAAAS